MTTIKKSLYLIECITNLHVGSGDSDFGLIDNRVQRDVITNFPTINSSSLKGAFAIHFNKDETDEKGKPIRTKDGEKIFGKGNNGNKDLDGQGKYKFFPANLLAIPARSIDNPYYLITSDQIIKDYNEMANLFGTNIKLNESTNKNLPLELEGELLKVEEISFKENKLYVLEDKEFSKIIENLPVIARNHLENGESQNLWYEEIVPRKSLFYFGIDKGIENEEHKILEDSFKKKIIFDKKENNLIHIGGNVTVGYGACKITKLGDE